MIQTYIIKTKKGEYYCGKTNDIKKRMEQHKNEKSPHWFGQYKNRKEFDVMCIIKGDFEKFIKRCGVKRLCELSINFVLISAP